MERSQIDFIRSVDNATNDDIFIKDTGREEIDLPPHSHTRTQIIQTRQGTLHVMIEGREYFVPEGRLCWIPSGLTHSLTSNNRQIALRIYYVKVRFTEKSPGCDFAVYNQTPWEASNFDYIARHGSVISKLNKTFFSFCMSFFNLLPDVGQRDILPLKGIAIGIHPMLKKALEFIHRHLAENLKQEDVAMGVGTSSRSLSRLFKDAGMTFSGYLTYQRITRALELMADHNMTMREIAYATGFSVPANFNRTFKQVMGVAPKEMMKASPMP